MSLSFTVSSNFPTLKICYCKIVSRYPIVSEKLFQLLQLINTSWARMRNKLDGTESCRLFLSGLIQPTLNSSIFFCIFLYKHSVNHMPRYATQL